MGELATLMAKECENSMRRKLFCLSVGLLFMTFCLIGCAGNTGPSPSPIMSASPVTTTSPAASPSPGITITPAQAAQVIGETPEKVFMENELQGTVTAGKAFAIAMPEATGATWQINAADGVEELPDGTLNTADMASDGQGGASPSPAASPAASPAGSPAGSPAASPAGSPAASPAGSPAIGASPGGSPAAEGDYHVWGFKVTDQGDYTIRISDTSNAATEKTFTITVKAAS